MEKVEFYCISFLLTENYLQVFLIQESSLVILRAKGITNLSKGNGFRFCVITVVTCLDQTSLNTLYCFLPYLAPDC